MSGWLISYKLRHYLAGLGPPMYVHIASVSEKPLSWRMETLSVAHPSPVPGPVTGETLLLSEDLTVSLERTIYSVSGHCSVERGI